MFYRQDRLWLKITELLLGWVILVTVDLIFDLRWMETSQGIWLLYILLFALRYGLYVGLGAFVLTLVYRFVDAWVYAEDLLLLFYETASISSILWTLFVAIVAGLFSTSYREKYESLQFLKEEAEDENEYLRDTVQLLENTQQMLQVKVLESDHSLSQIYQIGVALDQDLPELIRSEAMNVFERTFEASRVAIYHMDQSKRALRLLIKKNEQQQYPQSILIEESSSMYQRMIESQTITIRNVDDPIDSPVLLAPVMYQDDIREVVVIHDLAFEKITAHQIQVLSLIVDWISSRLQKASNLKQEKEKPKMFSGTRVYKKHYFDELVEKEEQKKQEVGLPYLLGKIRLKSTRDIPIIEAEMIVRSQIREIDLLGYDAGENELWFLFPGTDQAAREVVFPRIERVFYQKGALADG